jgi:hypothetical protein
VLVFRRSLTLVIQSQKGRCYVCATEAAQQRMKTVTWYIFNVLGKKKHTSPTFLESGFEWHIEAYPNGIDESCKGCGACESLSAISNSLCPRRFFSIGVFISAFPGFHTVLAKGCGRLCARWRVCASHRLQLRVCSAGELGAAAYFIDKRRGRRQRVLIIQPKVLSCFSRCHHCTFVPMLLTCDCAAT